MLSEDGLILIGLKRAANQRTGPLQLAQQTAGISRANMSKKFLQDESGATAIEYGLIAALIAVGTLGALTDLGAAVTGNYEYIETSYTNP